MRVTGRRGAGGPLPRWLATLRSAHRKERPSPVDATVGYVFISAAHVDSVRATALQQAFEAAGFLVWRDASALWPGEDRRIRIRNVITDDTLAFLACFSRASVQEKGYHNEELTQAIDQLRQRDPSQPWLIPVRFDDCHVPDLEVGSGRTLALLQQVDLFGRGADKATARLIAAVQRLLPPSPDEAMPRGQTLRDSRITSGRRRPSFFALGAAAATAAVAAGVGVALWDLTRPSAPDPPVKVEVVSDLQTLDEVSFVAPHPSVLTNAELSALDGSAAAGNSAYEAWLRQHGAVPTGLGLIGLTVAGNSATPVTITQLEIVKTCTQPLAGTLFYNPSNIGGPIAVPTIYFDLDSAVSVGTYLPPPGSSKAPGGSFFAKEVVTLNLHEQQTFEIQMKVDARSCAFSFRLTIATSAGPVTETIDDNGKPFSLTGADNGSPSPLPYSAYQAIYAGGKADPQHGGKFIRVDPERYHGNGDPESYALGS